MRPIERSEILPIGDILPQYVLSAADAAGSAADNKGNGVWKDGMWTVVVVRPLGLANPDDKALKAGGVYNVGFAVHDDNITSRSDFSLVQRFVSCSRAASTLSTSALSS